MKGRIAHIWGVVIALTVMAAACNPEAPYSLKTDTELDLRVEQVSAGFLSVDVTPSRDVYYLVSVEKVVAGIDLDTYQKQFMQLALDSAYTEYIAWRHNLLRQGVPVHQIASFQDHALTYGKADYFAAYLQPDTDYWVYAFVVNPETNKPVTRLFWQTVHTAETSTVYCKFRYRIRDTWDYVYPVDEQGHILSDFPYAGATVDSARLWQALQTYPEGKRYPANFFADSLTQLLAERDNAPILFGVFARNHAPEEHEGTLPFEEGVTYYTAFAGLDGGLNPGQNGMYRFTWHQGMDTVFSPDQSLGWEMW